MKHFIFILLFSLNSFSMYAQSDYDKSIDKETNAVIYKGEISFEDLLKEPGFSWFHEGITNYTPKRDAIAFLQKELPGYEVIVFIGTWCEDSHLMIPQLHNVLKAAEYPFRRLSLYGVNRAKETKFAEEKLYNISFVPTILLYKDGKEIGRIVESVQKSVEEDLVSLIQKQ